MPSLDLVIIGCVLRGREAGSRGEGDEGELEDVEDGKDCEEESEVGDKGGEEDGKNVGDIG